MTEASDSESTDWNGEVKEYDRPLEVLSDLPVSVKNSPNSMQSLPNLISIPQLSVSENSVFPTSEALTKPLNPLHTRSYSCSSLLPVASLVKERNLQPWDEGRADRRHKSMCVLPFCTQEQPANYPWLLAPSPIRSQPLTPERKPVDSHSLSPSWSYKMVARPSHRRFNSAPPSLPPLPSNFITMNNQDKEKVLRYYSTLEMKSSDETDSYARSMSIGSIDAMRAANIPAALREQYDLLLNESGSFPAHVTSEFYHNRKSVSTIKNASGLASDVARPPQSRVCYKTREENTPLVGYEEKNKAKPDEPLPERQQQWNIFIDGEEMEEHGRKLKKNFNVKAKNKKKQRDFENVRIEQVVTWHEGSINKMKFNSTGKYLATGGYDSIVRVWTVTGSSVDKERWQKKRKSSKPTQHSNKHTSGYVSEPIEEKAEVAPPKGSIINPVPYREFRGHKGGIIDIDWSNCMDFLLSSSFDSTVMLWHPSRRRCLSIFHHPQNVTSIHFHPESKNFVSAGFDSRIRLWNLLERRVIAWQQLETIVTAVTFSPDGKYIIAGLFNGRCVFYSMDYSHCRLKCFCIFECRNGRKPMKKVTSIKFQTSGGDADTRQCLVSTNDSRIRLLTIWNKEAHLTTKYKGHTNNQSQIAASFSYDGRFVICGSEDGGIYIWDKCVDNSTFFSFRRSGHTKVASYEVIRTSNGKKTSTTVAIFAPQRTVQYIEKLRRSKNLERGKINYIVLAADIEGSFKVLVNYEGKPT